jgi:high affinity Mn2+ porin
MKTVIYSAALIVTACLAGQAWAQSADQGAGQSADAGADQAALQAFAIHGQGTVVLQGHDAFTSPYRGPQSLDPAARGDETADLTLYVGVRPFAGTEIWIDPEIDQGFGLSNTIGIAGFPSGEAYKVGARDPYAKLPRLFIRQTIDLGGERQAVDPDLYTLGGSHTADRLVITVGKFGVPDVFDANAYAHDPRQDFLNWTIIDTGSFDYAADAWGFTYGASAELYKGPWALRLGWFDLSKVPNSASLDSRFDQYQWIAEGERRYKIAGRDGKIDLTGYVTHGRMASFTDALDLSLATGQPASAPLVRSMHDRAGFALNVEQSITDDLAAFIRAGAADGHYEAYEYTDVDRTFVFGLSEDGKRWGRDGDHLGAAVAVNGASSQQQAFLAAGGLGILVGDGQLPHPGEETDFETYYSLQVARGLHATLDYQFIDNPGYNRDRGPVSVLAVRLHAQY